MNPSFSRVVGHLKPAMRRPVVFPDKSGVLYTTRYPTIIYGRKKTARLSGADIRSLRWFQAPRGEYNDQRQLMSNRTCKILQVGGQIAYTWLNTGGFNMGQVAFDTLQASEELETAGISREQARAISLVVRKSHEVADVVTKADIAEVNRNIVDVRKDLSAEIADVRKDMTTQISLVRKDLQLEMAGIRSEQKLIRWMLGALIAGMVSLVIKAFFVTVA